MPTKKQIELKTKLETIGKTLWEARMELQSIARELVFQCDRAEAESIMTELTWATENCSVMAKHQIGKALNDNMGSGKVEP